MGGEKRVFLRIQVRFPGSPPRGRGKVQNVNSQTQMAGITPAWAGKSSVHALKGRQDEDHPRVGGEKTKKIP